MADRDEEKFSNKSVVKLLRQIAAAYILLHENKFKVIAYQKAADTIDNLSREIKDVWQEGSLAHVPGIGPSIYQHLDEYFKTGISSHFEQILHKIPASVFNLMEIPGIGVKTAARLVHELKLPNSRTIEALKNAARKHKIEVLEGFGKRSQEEILEAITRTQNSTFKTGRMVLPYAFEQAEEIKAYMKSLTAVERIDALGSLRRMVSTVGDIDLAVQIDDTVGSEESRKIIEHFVLYPNSVKTDNAGDKKASIIVRPDVRVDLRVQDKKSYGSMLQYFTGNKTHNIKLREYALKKGFSLSEYGLKNIQNDKNTSFSSEQKLYEFLGLQYIPPELRQGTDEIDKAQHGKLPKLVEENDIKGDMHLHSSFQLFPSHDLGTSTFEQFIDTAKTMNYEYLGFTEHNPKASLPDGRILKILNDKKSLTEKISRKTGFHIFNGLEVDVQPDGKLALPDQAIKSLDYIVAGIHSSFRMDKESMTRRVLRALTYPKVKILAHPTGRMINKREGFELDWDKIFQSCGERSIAIEVNAWPERLDLPDMLIRRAIEHKVSLVINTDSHNIEQMTNMKYGVATARRGYATKLDILNSYLYKEFKEWIDA